jgi:quinol monooxygenase YgiN
VDNHYPQPPEKPKEMPLMPLFIALSLLVTSELSIIDGKVQEFLTVVQDGLEVCRSFSGNQSFNIFVDQENPGKVLFIEQ